MNQSSSNHPPRKHSGQRSSDPSGASRKNLSSQKRRSSPPRKHSGQRSSDPSGASRKNLSSQKRRSSSRRRKMYQKSRYYRQRQKRLLLAGGMGLILLLVLLAFAVRSCADKKSKSADAQASQVEGTSKSEKTTSDQNDKKASSDTQSDSQKNPVLPTDPVSSADAQASQVEGTSKSEKTTSDQNDKKASSDTQSDSQKNPVLPTDPVSFTVSVVGDCTLGTDENFDYDTSLNAYYESYGSEYFFRNVKDIFSADDLTIANFEGTLTDSEEREEKQFAFKAPAEFSSILSDGAVEAVTLANNHSHDYGEQGFADTLAALDQEGITHFGYDETAVIEVKGIKVGLVGIYELKDHLERTEQLKQNIAKVKEQGAVITIVIFHWGNEKEEIPDSNQTTLGRLAIDEGADLVCGHHPHVLQGIETYKGKNIVYSLGNFCFGGNSYPSDMDSMIFQQTFTVDKSGVSTDNNTNIIPCSISSDYDYNNYQPTPAEGDR